MTTEKRQTVEWLSGRTPSALWVLFVAVLLLGVALAGRMPELDIATDQGLPGHSTLADGTIPAGVSLP